MYGFTKFANTESQVEPTFAISTTISRAGLLPCTMLGVPAVPWLVTAHQMLSLHRPEYSY